MRPASQRPPPGRSETTVFDRPTTSLAPAAGVVPDPSARPRPVTWTDGDIVGPYQVVRLLGRGGMGEVFEAIDLRGGTPVAIKVARRPLERAADRTRFLDEGRIAATISHPHVVYVLGAEEIHGVPVIVTELMEGGTLRDLLERRGRLAPAEAVDLMRQVTDGLEAVQRAGVLHRDVKPSNCFIDEAGRVKVGDFGLAIATRGMASTTGGRGGVAGTIAFASPEQLRGDPLDVRSDIYSAGATLYFLLTGKPPFIGDDATDTIAKVLGDPAPRVRADRADVARGLDRIVRQCLAKNPADRPRSYADMVRLLSPFGATAPTPAPLGLRALALIVDAIVLRIGTGAIVLAAMQWYQWVPPNLFVVAAPHAVLVLLYFGGTEAFWSATPGKRLFGLRVVRTGMRPLGAGRAFARAGLWMASTLPGLVVTAAFGSGDLVDTAVGAGVSGYIAIQAATMAGFLLSFSSARRRNGLAAWHDLATDTRVVSDAGCAERADRNVGTPVAPIVADDSERLGRFVVLDRSAVAGVIVAYDEALARTVWIREAPPDTAPVSAARRRVARPARLRWLAGSGDGDRPAWDAYDAPPGHPLREQSGQPRPWSIVRGWLLDLADEIAASEEDGTRGALAIGRVWVSDATATLLDWEIDPHAAADANAATEPPPTPQRFLYDAAVIGLGLGTPSSHRTARPAPLPLHVRGLLDELVSGRAGAVVDIVARLQALMERPALVARRRRLAHLVTCAAVPLLSVLLLVPVLTVVLPLLARSPDVFVLDACLRRLQALESVTTTTAVARERDALETYLVGRFRPVLSQPSGAKPWFWLMIDARQRTIQAALQRRPNPSPAETNRAAGALAELTSTAERHRARAADGQLGWQLLLAVVLALVALTAMAGLVSSLIVPGGLFLRQIDLAVVGPDGRAATRSRGFFRALIAWSPGLAAGVVFMLVAGAAPLDSLTVDRLLPSLALLGLFLGGGLFALGDPGRGLQDRLAGTSLVPR
jgi:eukaryotic-like serine/threonine-protein kinase